VRGRLGSFGREPVLIFDMRVGRHGIFVTGRKRDESRASNLAGILTASEGKLDFDLNFNLPLNVYAVVMLTSNNLLRDPQNKC